MYTLHTYQHKPHTTYQYTKHIAHIDTHLSHTYYYTSKYHTHVNTLYTHKQLHTYASINMQKGFFTT